MGKNWTTDLSLIVVLLLLMGYSLIGEEIHECLGLGMLLLLIFHHAINVSWYRNLKRGQYSTYRCIQTMLTALLFFTVLGSMLSGLALSQYVLDFLPLRGDNELARAFAAIMGLFLTIAHYGGSFLRRLSTRKTNS